MRVCAQLNMFGWFGRLQALMLAMQLLLCECTGLKTSCVCRAKALLAAGAERDEGGGSAIGRGRRSGGDAIRRSGRPGLARF